MEHLSRTLLNLRMHNAHACYLQEKWPTLCIAIKGGSARSLKRMGFRPSLPAEYVKAFSGQTEAPEVRCRLTDRHTQTHTHTDTATTVTLTVHVPTSRVNKYISNSTNDEGNALSCTLYKYSLKYVELRQNLVRVVYLHRCVC